MTIEEAIIELMELGVKFGYDCTLQLSGCYGSTTQNFYFEEAEKSREFRTNVETHELEEYDLVNVPTDLCSG